MGEGYFDKGKRLVFLEDPVKGTGLEPKPLDKEETQWIESKCRMV